MTEQKIITIPVAPSYDELDHAVGSLSRDEVASLARDMLNYISAPTKIWLPADMDENLEAYAPENRDAIRDEAQHTGYWRDLADCTDGDWSRVAMAVEDAATQLGIEAGQ